MYSLFFLFLLQNIDCGYSLKPPRWDGSNEYPQSMFWAEIWKRSVFLSESFQFLDVKFFIYLNRRVFVMVWVSTPGKGLKSVAILYVLIRSLQMTWFLSGRSDSCLLFFFLIWEEVFVCLSPVQEIFVCLSPVHNVLACFVKYIVLTGKNNDLTKKLQISVHKLVAHYKQKQKVDRSPTE